ncbi:MAG: hypothetical protein HXX11_17245 [Desulfuromonadales bacterium]|nr:hypothetical protein [Desulfuromonadales bacterium]
MYPKKSTCHRISPIAEPHTLSYNSGRTKQFVSVRGGHVPIPDGIVSCPHPDLDNGKGLTDLSKSNLLTGTIEFWKERSGIDVASEDAREMIENLSGLFRLLDHWDQSCDPEKQHSPVIDD